MAQEKLKLTKKASFIAEATRPDGSIVRFTKTNSSWYEYGITGRNIGDEFLAEVVISNMGNPMIERLNAEKYCAALTIESKILQRNILLKQEASL